MWAVAASPSCSKAIRGLAGGLTSGLIKGIAVASLERLPDFKDLPTVAETLPGFIAGGWNVLLAPVGTPDAIVQKASMDLRTAMDDADVKKKLAQLGAYVHAMTPGEVAQFAKQPATDLEASRRKGCARNDRVAKVSCQLFFYRCDPLHL